jgi:CO/xanthine dehydrogenase FAD-binding subunit
MRNQRTDFPVIACAVSQLNGNYRAVIGARPSRAMQIMDHEGMLSAGITDDSAKAFGAYVAAHAPTASNLRGSAAYRTRLIQVLTMRAALELGGK